MCFLWPLQPVQGSFLRNNNTKRTVVVWPSWPSLTKICGIEPHCQPSVPLKLPQMKHGSHYVGQKIAKPIIWFEWQKIHHDHASIYSWPFPPSNLSNPQMNFRSVSVGRSCNKVICNSSFSNSKTLWKKLPVPLNGSWSLPFCRAGRLRRARKSTVDGATRKNATSGGFCKIDWADMRNPIRPLGSCWIGDLPSGYVKIAIENDHL